MNNLLSTRGMKDRNNEDVTRICVVKKSKETSLDKCMLCHIGYVENMADESKDCNHIIPGMTKVILFCRRHGFIYLIIITLGLISMKES